MCKTDMEKQASITSAGLDFFKESVEIWQPKSRQLSNPERELNNKLGQSFREVKFPFLFLITTIFLKLKKHFFCHGYY